MKNFNKRHSAMNAVHKFMSNTNMINDILNILKPDDLSIYKNDRSLTKKARDSIKQIINDHNKDDLRVIIDDRHNSISLDVDCTYSENVGCSYYKCSMGLVCKFENTNFADTHDITKMLKEPGSRVKVNVPNNFSHLSDYKTNWTEAKIIATNKKIEALDYKIRTLKNERSNLKYWVGKQ